MIGLLTIRNPQSAFDNLRLRAIACWLNDRSSSPGAEKSGGKASIMKKILIASDHAGLDGKEAIKKTLEEMGVEYEDLGTGSRDSVDYPDYAERVAKGVAGGVAERGILVCGSGIGMEIAANKIPGVRAALAWNEETAKLARRHNDANIVAVGARTTPQETIDRIIRAFITTDFEGGRHQRRIEKIKKLEEECSSRENQ